jgi:hypothetical protein
MQGPNPTEPANYTGSYTSQYRVIIADILKELIKMAPNIHQILSNRILYFVDLLLGGQGLYYT